MRGRTVRWMPSRRRDSCSAGSVTACRVLQPGCQGNLDRARRGRVPRRGRRGTGDASKVKVCLPHRQGALYRPAVRGSGSALAQYHLDPDPGWVAGPHVRQGELLRRAGFLVKRSLGVKSAKELDGAAVCIQSGTTTELNLADYFRANGGMKYTQWCSIPRIKTVKGFRSRPL